MWRHARTITWGRYLFLFYSLRLFLIVRTYFLRSISLFESKVIHREREIQTYRVFPRLPQLLGLDQAGDWNSTQVFQALGPFSATFPDTLEGCWVGSSRDSHTGGS